MEGRTPHRWNHPSFQQPIRINLNGRSSPPREQGNNIPGYPMGIMSPQTHSSVKITQLDEDNPEEIVHKCNDHVS